MQRSKELKRGGKPGADDQEGKVGEELNKDRKQPAQDSTAGANGNSALTVAGSRQETMLGLDGGWIAVGWDVTSEAHYC